MAQQYSLVDRLSVVITKTLSTKSETGAGSFVDSIRIILVLQGVDVVIKISCFAAL